MSSPTADSAVSVSDKKRPAIAIHGGAGAIIRAAMSAEKERDYLQALEAIVSSGQAILAAGGSALDAVTEAVRLLEECPLFNAGKGAVFTHQGTHELDASIMDGRTLHAGAISCVNHIRNPILTARKVLELSPHVMFTGAGAESFAREHGQEMVDADYFSTPERFEQLQRAKSSESGVVLDHDGAGLMIRSMPIVNSAPWALSLSTRRAISRRRPLRVE